MKIAVDGESFSTFSANLITYKVMRIGVDIYCICKGNESIHCFHAKRVNGHSDSFEMVKQAVEKFIETPVIWEF